MIGLRFVRLIESHSDELAAGLMKKLAHSNRGADMRKVPEAELKERTSEVYRNLSDWLLTKTDADVERVYGLLGRRRAEQGVSLSSFCWALMMTQENLWDFLENQGLRERPLELLGGFDLLRLLEQFFDRAIFYAIVGYEGYMRQMEVQRPAVLFKTA